MLIAETPAGRCQCYEMMSTFIIDGWITYGIEQCCVVVICLIVVLIAETQSRQHQLLGGKVGPDNISDPNLAFDGFCG